MMGAFDGDMGRSSQGHGCRQQQRAVQTDSCKGAWRDGHSDGPDLMAHTNSVPSHGRLAGSCDPPPPPLRTSTSRPGVFMMTAYRALIRPSGKDAMGRSCILDSPPGRGMPACHSRRFKGERPTGAATG